MMISYTSKEFDHRYGGGSLKTLVGKVEKYYTPCIQTKCLADPALHTYTTEFAISKTMRGDLYYSIEVEWHIPPNDSVNQVHGHVRRINIFSDFHSYHISKQKYEQAQEKRQDCPA